MSADIKLKTSKSSYLPTFQKKNISLMAKPPQKVKKIVAKFFL